MPRMLSLGALALGSFALDAHAQQSCLDEYAAEIPGLEVEITGAEPGGALEMLPEPDGAALPDHCLVRGVIDRRTGVDDVEYGIRFALALPRAWNGGLLFQGGGGLNGSVAAPIGRTAAGEQPALARGFAVVSTDSGHEGEVFDDSFFADQQAALDFLYQAIDKVTVLAKQLVEAHYGRAAGNAYFVGCSTGGREGMIMSQRYPTHFDGIVAGAPAMRTGYSNLGMRSVSVALNRAAETDEDGRPIPGTALSGDEQALVVDAVLEACDANDGLEDEMIFDTQSCDFDPAALTCARASEGECLSETQARAIADAMAGPKAADGHPVYPGYLYDTGLDASGPGTIPGLLNGAASPVGPAVRATQHDVDAEARAAAADMSGAGDTHLWTNLSTFSQNGGKLLFYHGVSDPWFSALDTIGYYEKLVDDNGGRDAVTAWSRLFLVPGMGHCGGGEHALDEFDLLSAVVDWVERDSAPDRVTTTGTAYPGRSRPLCPYPSYAHYTGAGNPADAANFECRTPAD